MPAKRDKHLPIVALVGRANVGKSTLWNKLTETTQAIVSETPHTTRDRHYGNCLWRGAAIQVVDTGGMDAEQGNEIGRGILRQAEHAIREADLVLFLADAQSGALPQDIDLAAHVKKLNKHILLVANKTDSLRELGLANNKTLWQLQLGEAIPISAALGRGVGDLLDEMYRLLEQRNVHPQVVEDEKGLKLVIMGRPNVGKSSLMNAILGEERVIVSPIPHTTREPQDTSFTWKDKKVTLIDTAGMRKRSRIDRGIEEAGIERNERILTQADVALLVFDATEDPTSQDRHLAGLLENAGRGLILIANKWDLVEGKTTKTAKEYEGRIRQLFPFLHWAPMIFVSAKERVRTDKILDLAFQINEERHRQITYNALQKFMKSVVARKRPLANLGPSSPYIHDVTQIGAEPPSFLIVVRGEKETLHNSWLRFFENRLREKFGFFGTPIEVKSRNVPIAKTPHDKSAAEARKRPTRKKRPIGRRVGRY